MSLLDIGLFTGKKIDRDTGLYYFNARWYDPQLGRFITEDPIKDGINWYAYGSNNPLIYTDPTGLETVIMYQNMGPYKHLFIAQKDEKTGDVSTLSLHPKKKELAGLATIIGAKIKELVETHTDYEVNEFTVESENTPDFAVELKAAEAYLAGEDIPLLTFCEYAETPPVPEDMTQSEFDDLVKENGENYPDEETPYNGWDGPNSNTYVDDVIEDSNSTISDILGAQAQNSGESDETE